MGEAPEVQCVGEFCLTGFKAFVAPGENIEGVADLCWAHRGFEQSNDYVSTRNSMAQNLGSAPGIGTGQPAQRAECKPALGKA